MFMTMKLLNTVDGDLPRTGSFLTSFVVVTFSPGGLLLRLELLRVERGEKFLDGLFLAGRSNFSDKL